MPRRKCLHYHKATVKRVVSPVTLMVELDLDFGIKLTEPIRLNGVAMPSDAQGMVKAVQIIDHFVHKHPLFIVRVAHEHGRPFGRYLGDVMTRRGISLNKRLLNAGVAQEIPEDTIPEDETPLEPEPEEEVVEVPEDQYTPPTPEGEDIPEHVVPDLEDHVEPDDLPDLDDEISEELHEDHPESEVTAEEVEHDVDFFEDEEPEVLQEEYEEAVEEVEHDHWELKSESAH